MEPKAPRSGRWFVPFQISNFQVPTVSLQGCISNIFWGKMISEFTNKYPKNHGIWKNWCFGDPKDACKKHRSFTPVQWFLRLPKMLQPNPFMLQSLGFQTPNVKEIYIYIPGTCLSSMLGVKPSKTRPCSSKTRVIWVPGIYIYNWTSKTNTQQMKNLSR